MDIVQVDPRADLCQLITAVDTSKKGFCIIYFLLLSGYTGLEITREDVLMLAKLVTKLRPNPHSTFTGAMAEASLFLYKINVIQIKV